MKTIRLGGKDHPVKEPVFRQLRQIIPLYNALCATTDHADSGALITALLSVFFEHAAPRLGRVSEAELIAFIQAVPELAGLKPGDAPASATEADDWGGLYAHLAAYFGWTYDDIDNHMTLSRYRELSPYLKHNPPTHQLVAAFVGYERKEPGDAVRHFFKSLLVQAGK